MSNVFMLDHAGADCGKGISQKHGINDIGGRRENIGSDKSSG